MALSCVLCIEILQISTVLLFDVNLELTFHVFVSFTNTMVDCFFNAFAIDGCNLK